MFHYEPELSHEDLFSPTIHQHPILDATIEERHSVRASLAVGSVVAVRWEMSLFCWTLCSRANVIHLARSKTAWKSVMQVTTNESFCPLLFNGTWRNQLPCILALSPLPQSAVDRHSHQATCPSVIVADEKKCTPFCLASLTRNSSRSATFHSIISCEIDFLNECFFPVIVNYCTLKISKAFYTAFNRLLCWNALGKMEFTNFIHQKTRRNA